MGQPIKYSPFLLLAVRVKFCKFIVLNIYNLDVIMLKFIDKVRAIKLAS